MIAGAIKRMELQLPSALAEVRQAVDKFLDFLKGLPLSEDDLFDLRLCVEESLINAIKYGNRENRELPVKFEAAYSDSEIFLAVEDRGNGFDPAKLKDPTQECNLEAQSGRGVFLIRKLMDSVSYNAKGNRVEMVKRYGGE